MQMKISADNFLKYENGVCVKKDDLFMVSNCHDKSSMWLHFNPDDIKNYHKSNDVVRNKIDSLLQNELEIARQEGQSGIKKLSNCTAEVEFTVNGKNIKKPISYEIKIAKSPSRVGLIMLNSTEQNTPPLLVATLFMEDGLHKGKAKKYCKQAYLLDKHGLFNQKTPSAKLDKELRNTNDGPRGPR